MKDIEDLNFFLSIEENIQKKSLRYHKKQFDCYEHSFNLLIEIYDFLCDLSYAKKEMRTFQNVAILLLIPQVIQRMQAIRCLTLRGYYYDTRILERNLAEIVGLCSYFVFNKGKAKEWLEGKRPQISKKDLVNYTSKIMQPKNKKWKEPDLKTTYETLCRFVHNDFIAIFSSSKIKFLRKPDIEVKIIPSYDKDLFLKICTYPLFISALLLEIFKNELENKYKKYWMNLVNIKYS